MNRLRMQQRACTSPAKREVERIGARLKKLLNLMLDDEVAVDEGKAEIKALGGRSCRRDSRQPTSRRRSCIPRWPACTARR
jgi:hypothetical protein